VVGRPLRGAWSCALGLLLGVALALAAPAPAHAQGKGEGDRSDRDAGSKKASGDNKVFDFTAMDLSGRLRTPQLLYFLDRASEELKRASLERRSFIPEMVRTIDEESL
jgi:hypothetical protein